MSPLNTSAAALLASFFLMIFGSTAEAQYSACTSQVSGFCDASLPIDPDLYNYFATFQPATDSPPIIITGPGEGASLGIFSRVFDPKRPGLAQLEAVATRIVADQLGAEVDDRLRNAARGQIKALVFIRLIKIIETSASERSAEETLVYDEFSALIRERRRTVAAPAKLEWSRWFSGPCLYQVPVGDDPNAYLNSAEVVSYCGLAGTGNPFQLLISPVAIEAEQFLTWANEMRGNALMADWVDKYCYADCSDPVVREQVEEGWRRAFAASFVETHEALAYHNAMGSLVSIPGYEIDNAQSVSPTLAADLREALAGFTANYVRDFMGAWTIGIVLSAISADFLVPDLHDIGVFFVTGITLTTLEIIDQTNSKQGVEAAVTAINEPLETILATNAALGRGELLTALLELSVPELDRDYLDVPGIGNRIADAFSPDTGASAQASLEIEDWRRGLGMTGFLSHATIGYSDDGWLVQETPGGFDVGYDGVASKIRFVDSNEDFKTAWMIRDDLGQRRFIVTNYAERVRDQTQAARVRVELLLNNDCPQEGTYQETPINYGFRCVVSANGVAIGNFLQAGDEIIIGGASARIMGIASPTAIIIDRSVGVGLANSEPILRVDLSLSGPVTPTDSFTYKTSSGAFATATFLAESPPVVSPIVGTLPDENGMLDANPRITGGTLLAEPDEVEGGGGVLSEQLRLGYAEGSILTFEANVEGDDTGVIYDWQITHPTPSDWPIWQLVPGVVIQSGPTSTIQYEFRYAGSYTVDLQVTSPSGVSIRRGFVVQILDTQQGAAVATPVVSALQPISNGWYPDDVDLSWDIADPFNPGSSSAGFECYNQMIRDDGIYSYRCETHSPGGYAVEDVVIRRDATPPTIDAIITGTYVDAYDVTFVCADLLSGIDDCTGTVTLTSAQLAAGFVGVAQDVAGNVSVLAVDATLLDLVYVDETAMGTGDGSSWDDAHTSLQVALQAASAGQMLLVAEGEYTPTDGGSVRSDTFTLQSGVTLVGGFPSGGGVRDVETHPSRLSGNIDGDGSPASAGDSHHVVTALSVDATAVLDGFFVSGGNANGAAPANAGGGLRIGSGGPTIRQTIVEFNAAEIGGGAYVETGSPTFASVRFEGNQAVLHGGGLDNVRGASVLDRVTFVGNSVTGSSGEGGAIFSVGDGTAGSATLLARDTRLFGNTAFRGGAISNWQGAEMHLDNVIATGNEASDVGGAILNFLAGAGSLGVNNGTFADNVANAGAAVYSFDTVKIGNTILSGAGEQLAGSGTFDVTDSLTPTAIVGEGNIVGDPSFLDRDGADDVSGTLDDDVRPSSASVAIGAGGLKCASRDITGLNRFASCDQGAFEFVGTPGTFWSNGSFDALYSTESVDSTPVGGLVRQSADDFQIGTDLACDLTSIRMGLADPTSSREATFEIYTDVGGRPGVLLYSDQVSASSEEKIGALSGIDVWNYELALPSLRLDEGTYWVSAYGGQETSPTGPSSAASAGEGRVLGNPHQFRQAGFSWVDGGAFNGRASHDLVLDVDAVCGCSMDSLCDDGDPDTVDACVDLVCANVVPAAPSNDLAENYQGLVFGMTQGTLLGATNDGDAQIGSFEGKDVWYAYTASEDGIVRFDTCGSHDALGVDTMLSLHTEALGVFSNQISANNDWDVGSSVPAACAGVETQLPNRDAVVLAVLAAGETVYLRVAQFSDETNGDFVLNVSESGAPPAVPVLMPAFAVALLVTLTILGAASFRRPGSTGDASLGAGL